MRDGEGRGERVIAGYTEWLWSGAFNGCVFGFFSFLFFSSPNRRRKREKEKKKVFSYESSKGKVADGGGGGGLKKAGSARTGKSSEKYLGVPGGRELLVG